MPPRRAPKRDSNEREIIDFLEINGCSVVQLDGAGIPDLAVGFAGQTYLLEVKNGKQGKLTSDQQQFFKQWIGHAIVVRNIDDAKQFIRTIKMDFSNLQSILNDKNETQLLFDIRELESVGVDDKRHKVALVFKSGKEVVLNVVDTTTLNTIISGIETAWKHAIDNDTKGS